MEYRVNFWGISWHIWLAWDIISIEIHSWRDLSNKISAINNNIGRGQKIYLLSGFVC